ncbi:cytochrome P450 [Anaerolineales bacterium]
MLPDKRNRYPIFHTPTRANPQAMYAQMRQQDPVYRAIGPNTGNPIWFFTRYADVMAVLKDPRFIKNYRNLPPEIAQRYTPADENPTWAAINRHLLEQDPPDHTRLRALVHKAFTPNHIRALEPRIIQIVDHLLDAMAARNEGDLIADFAFPLPITVIAEMLGVPAEDQHLFREWTQTILFQTDEEQGLNAAMAFIQYMNERIQERRTEDRGDILSALIREEEAGDQLDHMELLSMIFLLLVAGHETTVNLIGNGVLALLTHPSQFEKLKQQPALIHSAVEEMLRYNGPVETPTLRFASENVEWDGQQIAAGDIILPSLLGANRDPAVFENPDDFNIERSPNPHLAFGNGIHFCLGAPLARLEGTLAISRLIQRYPDLRLVGAVQDLEWNATLLIHGLKHLPVAY